jgi:Zn-dependent peptidase ImmA (M78 family)
MKNLSRYIVNSSIPLTQLSKKSGISIGRLKELAEESADASYNELSLISSVLNLPISFLLSEQKEENQYEVLFRKQYGAAADVSVVSNFDYFINAILELDPDSSKVEKISALVKHVDNTYENADALAHFFREIYFDGNHFDPLNALPDLLSNKLNFIVKVRELGPNCDGASASIKNLVFLIVSPRFEGRMLFTLAHELGHVLNHHEQGDYVYFDKKISLKPKEDPFKVEGFANAFASCLLLPEKGVAKLISRVREAFQIMENSGISDIEILHVSRFYGVSFDVAAFRCESLSLIPKGGAFSLSQKIKEDFGSAEKRADLLGIPAREPIQFPIAPNFVLDKAVSLIQDGKYSIGKIADLLSIPVKAILDHNSKVA